MFCLILTQMLKQCSVAHVPVTEDCTIRHFENQNVYGLLMLILKKCRVNFLQEVSKIFSRLSAFSELQNPLQSMHNLKMGICTCFVHRADMLKMTYGARQNISTQMSYPTTAQEHNEGNIYVPHVWHGTYICSIQSRNIAGMSLHYLPWREKATSLGD